MSTRRGGDQHAYPIVTVDDRWAAGPEQMGSKPKFWCLPDGQEALRLFKFPQAGTGQHWAEKIAAEVAACLGILHAAVDLAVFRRYRGSVSTSFTHRKRRRELSHGNELLGWTRPYDPDKRFGQSGHNLVNIFRALEDVFKTEAGARSAKRQLAEYIVLDGLIGNTDRHHENWGLLLKRTRSALWGIVAPTFDHASSLGRELSDEKRRTRLQNGTVGQYSEKGRGAIFLGDSGRYGPSPLHLVREAAKKHPDLFREPLTRVRDRRSGFEKIVRRVPDEWMSRIAKDFSVALLNYNATQLERCMK